MISPHTAPGTRVVCVKLDEVPIMLTLGQLYVVEQTILLNAWLLSQGGIRQVVGVQVRGLMCPSCGGHLAVFDLDNFDYAALPETLTKQLDATPVNDLETMI